jgi:hypothetical protein
MQFVDTYRENKDIYSFEIFSHIEQSKVDLSSKLTDSQLAILGKARSIMAA